LEILVGRCSQAILAGNPRSLAQLRAAKYNTVIEATLARPPVAGHQSPRRRAGQEKVENDMRRFVAVVVAVAFAVLASAVTARADSFPSRPITIVVPYPAGGPTDTIARLLAQRMQKPLGQPVVVINISGGGGSIGVGRVAHSPPDGYMLSIGHTQTAVFNPAILKLDYDPLKDLAPVSLIADTPIWIVSGKTLPASDVKGLIAWLKADGGKATMATVGVGGPTDVAARLFEKVTGTAFQIVPYRGGAPVAEDLLGGHVDFAFSQAAGTLPYVQSGQLKAFAVLQAKR
jgi:tripartite-type tricarboxylate transporter receptor subunit TctC